MIKQVLSISAPGHRLSFIDVMRGIAVIMMIEGHSMNSMLNPDFKTGIIYTTLNLLSGFASASFVFCAGAGFWLAVNRKGEDYRAFKKPLWVYLRRLAFIMAMAYWIHLPVFSFEKTLALPYSELLRFLECNVLQLIVGSSLVALLLFFLIPQMLFLKIAFLLGALLVFFFTPYIWSLDPFKNLPLPVALFFAKQPLSAFPLFPWSGYFFAGVAFAGFFLHAADMKQFAKIAAGISFAGIFLFLYGSGLWPFELPGYNDWWFTSPAHSLYRASGVICVFSLLYLASEKIKDTKIERFLLNAGQESFFIYIFHLMIVYGSVLNVGLNAFLKEQLHPLMVLVLIVLITWASYSLAIMWKSFKTHDISRARRVITALVLLFLLGYFLVPAGKLTVINDAFKEKWRN